MKLVMYSLRSVMGLGPRMARSSAAGGAVLLLLLLLLLHTNNAAAKPAPDAIKFNITIPADATVTPEPDAYVCTTLPLPAAPMKLVGIAPLARQEVVHHILLFGCSVPHMVPKGGAQPVWDCKRAPTCGSFEETILYGWGRNAPELQLPDGVGFSVGKGSGVRYIVMQVHYLQPKPAGDTSGVALTLQPTPVPFAAGMLSYASWFTIPPGKKEHLVPNSCCYAGFQPLTTFAVRVHTHTLGRNVEMVRLAPGGGPPRNETLAKGDPLAPQGFNPVAPRVIHPGDRLTVTCTFDSSGVDHPVTAGPTHDHEMCNMYLMAFSKIPHIEMCSDGSGLVSETQPGSLPAPPLAKLAAAPAGGWGPPKPDDKSGEGVIGDVTSVTVAPSGNLWALHRGGRVWDASTFTGDHKLAGSPAPIAGDVVVEMDPDSGKVLRRWGAGHFYMPHMLTVDRNGDVWVADVGRHQVLKFSPDGKLLLEVGAKLEPGPDSKHFCKPTQVAPLRDGGFIVSDGYCNARAARFDAAGTYVGSYSLGPEREEGGGGSFGPQIQVAHSVLADECGRRLYLADREGRRVLVFDLDSRKLTQSIDLAPFGRVWALRAAPYGGALALTWENGRDAALVEISRDPPAGAGAAGRRHWPLPDTAKAWPHDFALGAAPLELSGAGDRLFAVYAAPLCQDKCGPVRKYVLHPHAAAGAVVPGAGAAPAAAAAASGKPVLAHFGGHGGHGGAGAAAGEHADDGKPADEKDDSHEEEEEEDKEEAADDHHDDDDDKHTEEEEAHAEEEEEEEEELEDDEQGAEAAAAAKASASEAAAKKSLADGAAAAAGSGGSGYSSEVHETLHITGRRASGGGGGAFAIAITAAALAALVGAAGYAVVAARRAGGGGDAAAAARRRRGADDAKAVFGGSSELVKLAPRHQQQHNGGGAADGDAHEIVFGNGRNGGGPGSDGGGGDADADEDLERLEREVLLRNGTSARV